VGSDPRGGYCHDRKTLPGVSRATSRHARSPRSQPERHLNSNLKFNFSFRKHCHTSIIAVPRFHTGRTRSMIRELISIALAFPFGPSIPPRLSDDFPRLALIRIVCHHAVACALTMCNAFLRCALLLYVPFHISLFPIGLLFLPCLNSFYLFPCNVLIRILVPHVSFRAAFRISCI
jgi:hypothetical protein